MSKKVIELKWKAVKASDTFADVYSSNGSCVCTVWSKGGGFETAQQIASDHNAILKANRALKNTPFKTVKA